MSSLSNAVRLLLSFTAETPRLGVTELANAHGLPKSTVSRTMKELEAAGLSNVPDGRLYQPGPQMFRIGSLYRTAEVPLDRIDGHLASWSRSSRRAATSPRTAVSTASSCACAKAPPTCASSSPKASILPAYTVAVGKGCAVAARRGGTARAHSRAPHQQDAHYSVSRREFLAELAEVSPRLDRAQGHGQSRHRRDRHRRASLRR